MTTILEELTKYRGILSETLMWDDRPEAYVRSYSGDEYIAPNQEQANAYYAAVKAKDWDTVLHFEETWPSFDNLLAKGISLDQYHNSLNAENVTESKCKFCHKPVELIPSAAARAKKHGGSPSDYTNLFPNHAECELANRKKGDSDLMARKRKENVDTR